MKYSALRSLDFIRIILSSSSLLLVGGPAVTTVIYLANLITAEARGPPGGASARGDWSQTYINIAVATSVFRRLAPRSARAPGVQ